MLASAIFERYWKKAVWLPHQANEERFVLYGIIPPPLGIVSLTPKDGPAQKPAGTYSESFISCRVCKKTFLFAILWGSSITPPKLSSVEDYRH